MTESRRDQPIFEGTLADGRRSSWSPAAESNAKYADFENSGLSATIEAGKNKIEFKVGEIIRASSKPYHPHRNNRVFRLLAD